MAERRPARVLGTHDREFWEFCNEGELRLQKCDSCGHYEWPPTLLCSECLHQGPTWTPVSGRGRIMTHCSFERPYFLECPPPWPVILVELEEGPWFISNPVGIPWNELKIGMPMKATFIDCEDDAGQFKLPVFERA